jgi:lipopolysaccharide transport system ATP-binding protein
VEYSLSAPITGLRLGIYLLTSHGEPIFTSFDTDDPQMYDSYPVRPAGRYVSRCVVPPDFLNEGRYLIGVNASSYRVRRYFQENHAINFSVDGTGSPGKQWVEARLGPVRPRLAWEIEEPVR